MLSGVSLRPRSRVLGVASAVAFVVAVLLSARGRAQVAVAAPPTSAEFDAAQLLADLRELSSDQMAGRAIGSPGNARARAALVARFRAVGLKPVAGDFEQPFAGAAAAGRRPRPGGVNIVGVVPGTRTPERYLVVSAHYDHVGVQNGQVFNGANDNASGAAALAAIGASIVRRPLGHSVLVVAFDGEEADLQGSRAFVRAPPVPREAMRLNLNADMIGRDASRTLFFTGTPRFPGLRPVAERVAAAAPVRTRIGHDGGDSGEDWIRQSDQWAFIEAGIPALYIGVDDQAFLHSPADDFDSMMPDFYIGSVETIIALVRAFDAQADLFSGTRAPR